MKPQLSYESLSLHLNNYLVNFGFSGLCLRSFVVPILRGRVIHGSLIRVSLHHAALLVRVSNFSLYTVKNDVLRCTLNLTH